MSAPHSQASPAVDENQPSAEIRLRLINARAARTLFAISAAVAMIAALLLVAAHAYQGMDTAPSAALWALFGLAAAASYQLPVRIIERGGLATFLAAGVTMLLANAALTTQGVQTVGLIFLPLLLMIAALLVRPLHALLLAAWALVGLLVLHRGPALGLWSTDLPVADGQTHLVGLLLSSAMALLVGLLAALRFAQAARLSSQHEIRYRDLFDRIPSGVVLHDNGRILDANRAALKILGEQRRSALIGRDVRDYLLDDKARARFEQRAQLLAAGSDGEILPVEDVFIRRRDGTAAQVRASATVIYDIEHHGPLSLLGQPASQRHPLYLSFMLDDTQRLMAQAETARVRALLEAVLSHSPYAFALTRLADAQIVECNQAYQALVGRSRGELLGHSEVELGIWTRAADREWLIDALQRQAEPSEQLLRLNRGDGQRRLVKGNGALLSFDGVDYLLMIGRDVTDLVRRETERQTVLEHAPMGVATTLGNLIVSANPRLHEIFGRAPGDLIGLHTRELWPDQTQHDAREARVLGDLSRHGLARFEDEFMRQGQSVAVRLTGRPIPDTGEGRQGVVWIAEDITQDRHAQQALRAAAQVAEAANRAKSAFLANMSHELRTPLNGILGLLDMALDTERGAEQQRQYVDLARESSRVLFELLSDVLDLSKIEAGRLTIDHAPFDLQAMIDSLYTVNSVLAEHRGLRLRVETDLGSRPSPWVHGDALRVRQILSNYLSNALKFTPEGEIALRIRTLPDPAKHTIRFEVEDTGPGIDVAMRTRLFQAFEQGDASPTRRQGGSGLGLAICRELAGLMGGQVGLVNAHGRGSLFWVELPLPPAAAANAEPPPAASASTLAGLRILVAEDNPVNMLITTAILERAGALVTGVGDGQSAVHAVLRADAQACSYDLLIMDIQMPGLDGLQATQALRLTHPQHRLPIVALTAGALQAERDTALRAGMNDFITKPVDRQALLSCVARHARAGSLPATSAAPAPVNAAS